MSKFITLTGLSRFLYDLREDTKPFYVKVAIGAEEIINTYDCKFSDIVKAWEKGRPVYVRDGNSTYMIIEAIDIDTGVIGQFHFFGVVY